MAQVVELQPEDTLSEENRSDLGIFGQASLGAPLSANQNNSFAGGPGGFIPPNVTLKTLKLTALLGKGEWGKWDFYIINTVPTLTVQSENEARESFSSDLLHQIGGMFNVSLSKVAYFANGGDKENKDIRGAQFDFRAGGKVVDAKVRTGNNFLIPMFQSSLDLRYLIPLVDPKKKQKENVTLRDKLAGNLSFRVYSTFMQIGNQEKYANVAANEKGVSANTTVLTLGGEINLFITGAFFISGGYAKTFDTHGILPDRAFIGLSYLK